MMVVVGDERGIVYSCPVARMASTLASRSSFAAASKSGPLGILCIGLHADIVEQKCHTRETRRFVNHTSMRLKTSALASHQNLLAILRTNIEIGIHWRKHRIKQIEQIEGIGENTALNR